MIKKAKISMLLLTVLLMLSACTENTPTPGASDENGSAPSNGTNVAGSAEITDDPSSGGGIEDGRKYTTVELLAERWWLTDGEIAQHLSYERNEYGNYISISQYDADGKFTGYTTNIKVTESGNSVTVEDSSKKWIYSLDESGNITMIIVRNSKDRLLLRVEYLDKGESKYLATNYDASESTTYEEMYIDENYNCIKSVSHKNGSVTAVSIMEYSENGNLISRTAYIGKAASADALISDPSSVNRYTYEDSGAGGDGKTHYEVTYTGESFAHTYYTDEDFETFCHSLDKKSGIIYKYTEIEVLNDGILLAYFTAKPDNWN